MTPQFSQLLYQLYACAKDPNLWSSALEELARALNVHTVALQWCDLDGQQLQPRESRVNLQATLLHQAYQLHITDAANPRLKSPRLQQWLDRTVRDGDILGNSRVFTHFNHQLSAIGLGRFIGCASSLGDGRYLTLAAHQPLGQSQDYSAEQIQLIDALGPHLRQVSALGTALHQTAALQHDMSSLLDSMRAGVLLCDPTARLLWCNQAAEQLLTQAHAPMQRAAGQLRCRTQADWQRLQEALAQTEPHYLCLGCPHSPQQWQLSVQTLPPGPSPHATSRRLITFCQTHATPELPPTAIGSLFGLTPAESRLTAALCRGLSLQDYAREGGFSEGALRVLVKHVLAKTQTHRQADLVRLVLSSVLLPCAPAHGSHQHESNTNHVPS